ncbi:hypothetical protein [Nostoc sp.]|uniref:hypothetical protein n=1 Tax=Nostoc sp. TaxID=1180 RepID=UPI002FFD0672
MIKRRRGAACRRLPQRNKSFREFLQANLPKSLQVIANEAKRNETIATSVLCDRFA